MNSETLGEALPKEIERCQQLLQDYKEIPAGKFAAIMIEHDIQAARKAIIRGRCGGDDSYV